jgi:hypothetical protein
MFRDGELTYDLFARGAARLSERLLLARRQPSEQGFQWRWIERTHPTGGASVGVLELERWLPAANGAPRARDASASAGAEDPDGAALAPTSSRHRYVFHAAHSAVYRAPVLCWRAERADGAPLPPEQVRADLSPWLEAHGPQSAESAEGVRGEQRQQQHGASDESHEEGKDGGEQGSGEGAPPPGPSWDFYLARGEHPGGLPGAPAHVYYLHPCRTPERMALLMAPPGGGGADEAAAAGGASETDAAASRYLAAWLSAVAPAVGLPRPPQPEEEIEDEGAARERRRR